MQVRLHVFAGARGFQEIQKKYFWCNAYDLGPKIIIKKSSKTRRNSSKMSENLVSGCDCICAFFRPRHQRLHLFPGRPGEVRGHQPPGAGVDVCPAPHTHACAYPLEAETTPPEGGPYQIRMLIMTHVRCSLQIGESPEGFGAEFSLWTRMRAWFRFTVWGMWANPDLDCALQDPR